MSGILPQPYHKRLNDISRTNLNGYLTLVGGEIAVSSASGTGFVPYTGAIQNLNLGYYSLIAQEVISNYIQSTRYRIKDTGGDKFWIYKIDGDPTLYFRDMVNSRMHMLLEPGASNVTANTTFNSNVNVSGGLNVDSLTINGNSSVLSFTGNGDNYLRNKTNFGPVGVNNIIIDGTTGNASFNEITSAFQSLSADPTTLDIPSGKFRLIKNTTSGEIKHWVNDGGIMKSSPAYT